MADNKHRAEIALPEGGEGAFVRFTVDSLEKLESVYGENFFEYVQRGLTRAQISVYKKCVEVAVHNMTVPFPFGMSLEELQGRLSDSLYLCVFGRNFDEQQKHQDEEFQKKLEEAQSNPRLAAALFSKSSGEPGTGQV